MFLTIHNKKRKMKPVDDYILAKISDDLYYTIGDYKKDIYNFTLDTRSNICNALKIRLLQRYVVPCLNSSNRNGFNMMANSCLVIETLESFHNGWENSPKHGKAFLSFFKRSKRFVDFSDNGIPRIFYEKIRCGILHQGETESGWRLRRDNTEIICLTEKTINAEKFMLELKKEIEEYFDNLIKIETKETDWSNIIKKMDYIIKNCET